MHSRRCPRIASLGLLVCALSFAARGAIAEDRVAYIGTPPPAVSGVLLPDVPSELDSIFFRSSLGSTFGNSCRVESLNGEASVSVDAAGRTVVVDFDEETASPSATCPLVYEPVDAIQIEFGPLAPGSWTLEIDEMFTILVPIPSQTIPFEVVAAEVPVPAGGLVSTAILAGVLLLAGGRALRRRSAG